jgi:hypothetical protein
LSFVLTDAEGTSLILVPRVADLNNVRVIADADEKSLALVETVFQRATTHGRRHREQHQGDVEGNRRRVSEFLVRSHFSVTDDGGRILVEGGVASIESPFASPDDCKSTNAVVLDRIRKLMAEM